MDLDEDRIDDAVLALLNFGLHNGNRAWKGFDWDVMDRLHEQGYISSPRTNVKSGPSLTRAAIERLYCWKSCSVEAGHSSSWLQRWTK